ncbi:restriction endonuclease subunit S [Novilysobacter selenitireducens]|uniref:Restriction endonuclease subunit S n=1 Tax=Novilysobacter selenitireducens TaxID=2872639 RepID=A0ABS7T2G8_9GAMM|nr:hypothetical protein [Lysobacter selenitireducens]MBZ4038064.1 hypothetical protein [Lysobacter selenitireducens]
MTSALQELAMWRRVHVADVCETVSVGIVIQPSQYYVAPSQGIRAFRSANVGENRIVDRDWVYLSPEGHRANSKSSLRAGDVLVVRSGAPGTACVVTDEYAGSNCIDIVFARPHQDQVLPKYLAEFTNSPVGRRHVLGTQGGLALKHFNVGAYKQLELLLPEVAEQKRIVDLFAAWETAIQKTEHLIAAKERHYSHELSRLISRGQHPHAHVGTSAEEVSARSPRGTPALLGDYLTESREPDTDQDPAKRLTVRLHLQGVESRPVRGTDRDGATAYFRRHAGQLIYGKQNIFRGAIGIIPPKLDGCASTQDLPAFDIADGIDPQWLYFWLSRKDFYTSLEALATGSGSKRLHPEEFFKVRIYIPDFATQTAIARYLNALRDEIDLLGQSVAALKTQKRGLMQKLLTGQWRLPVPEQEGA